MQILKDQHQRALPGKVLEEQPGAAVDLPAHGLPVQVPDPFLPFRRGFQPQHRADVWDDLGHLGRGEPADVLFQFCPALDLTVLLGDPCATLDDLPKRPVPDHTREGEGAAFRPEEIPVRRKLSHLRHQARLAQARIADDGGNASPTGQHTLHTLGQGGELSVATHQGRTDALH